MSSHLNERKEIAQKAIAARWAKAGKSTSVEQVSSAGKLLNQYDINNFRPYRSFPWKIDDWRSCIQCLCSR